MLFLQILSSLIITFGLCDATYKTEFSGIPTTEQKYWLPVSLKCKLFWNETIRRRVNPICSQETATKKHFCEQLLQIDEIKKIIGESVYTSADDTRTQIDCESKTIHVNHWVPYFTTTSDMIFCLQLGPTQNELSNKKIYISEDYNEGFYLWSSVDGSSDSRVELLNIVTRVADSASQQQPQTAEVTNQPESSTTPQTAEVTNQPESSTTTTGETNTVPQSS